LNKGTYFHFSRPEGFAHIEMVGYRRLLERDHLRLHRNPGIEIISPMRGCFQWMVEGQVVDLRPGEVSVTLPWQEHGGKDGAFNVGELCWIILKVDWHKGSPLQLGNWSHLPTDLVQSLGETWSHQPFPLSYRHRTASDGMMGILKELQEKGPHSTWSVNRIIDDLLFSLFRSTPLQPSLSKSEPSLAIRLKLLLDAHPHRSWSLEALSKALFQSPSCMNRELREETGYSTMELVTLYRIEKAKSLLIHSNMNITQIALDCGFKTSQYFSSVFRKWVGVSPMCFKES